VKKYFLSGILVIIIFLLYNLILSFGSLEGTPKNLTGNPPFPYLTAKPLTEDGYYMLTVAWNIAQGKGFAYNYGIKTTGVQPLATLLYAVTAYLVQSLDGDKYDLARAVIILSALLQVLFSFLIYRLALAVSVNPVKGLYFLISVCVVLLNFKVLLNFANGLETGLYLVLLAFFFLYWINHNQVQPGYKRFLGLGVLSGLLLLCRLDSVIILFFFYMLLLFTGRIKIGQLAVILFIAFLLYLPWQLYIWEISGNLLQSSARSQIAFLDMFDPPYKAEQYFSSIIQHLTPFLFTGNILWLLLTLGIVYIIIFYIGFEKFRDLTISKPAEKTLGLILFSFTVLVIVYFIFSCAPHFYFRYTAFIMILSFPVFVVLFVYLLRNFSQVKVYLIFSIILILFGIQSFLYFHAGKSARAHTVRVEFVENNFSEDVKIAAFQTGILGYFCENVINLDGKIDNSALESFSNGGIENYIDSMCIDVLMEWKDFVPILLNKDYLEKYWQVYSDDIGDGRTICYVRKKR
jgi:hypothetical protein